MKILRNLLAISFIIGVAAKSNGQSYGCATDEYHQQFLDASEENRANFAAFTDQFNEYVANRGNQRSDAEYIIPVVVHVLYNTCENNISMAQIQNGLDLINADFSRTNPDTSSTRAEFVDVAADASIEFRLARLDPNGDPTDGVVRLQTSQAIDAQNNVKSLSYWSSANYLNIWIVESIYNFAGSGGTILGYAQFPGSGSWNTYGLVVRNDAFGTIGTSNADGRTVTHEIGHCLNLYHTFQDGCGGNCAFSGDYVCDTPPAAGATYDCSSGTNTCSNDAFGSSPYTSNVPDMIENYMSYNSCQNLFTEGQKTRMVSVLETVNVLEGLVSEDNLIETGVMGLVEADFSTDAEVICQSQSVAFSDASYYDGTATSWEFGGEAIPPTSTDLSPNVVFPYPGLFDVTYTAEDNSIVADKTKSVFVVSSEGQFAPYTDDMESYSQVPSSNWFANNVDQDEYEWKVSNEAAFTGEQSLKLDNYGKCGSRTDELISQSFDFSPYSSVNISFELAFARADALDNVFLRMYTSADCGETWNLGWARSTSQLQTISTPVANPFIPADETEWQEFTISLSSAILMKEGVLLKFEFGGNGGNNLYIDDFNINGTFSGDLLLRSPENGKIGMATDVLIDWKAVGFVESYEYEIDKVATFDSQDKISGTTSYIDATPNNEDTEFLAESLELDTKYYWRVRYVQSAVESAWSETWDFTISETGASIENASTPSVNVYPNPTDGLLNISAEEGIEELQFFDYTGRVVHSETGNSQTSMTLSMNLIPGMYLLKIETVSGSIQTKPIVIR